MVSGDRCTGTREPTGYRLKATTIFFIIKIISQKEIGVASEISYINHVIGLISLQLPRPQLT